MKPLRWPVPKKFRCSIDDQQVEGHQEDELYAYEESGLQHPLMWSQYHLQEHLKENGGKIVKFISFHGILKKSSEKKFLIPYFAHVYCIRESYLWTKYLIP